MRSVSTQRTGEPTGAHDPRVLAVARGAVFRERRLSTRARRHEDDRHANGPDERMTETQREEVGHCFT